MTAEPMQTTVPMFDARYADCMYWWPNPYGDRCSWAYQPMLYHLLGGKEHVLGKVTCADVRAAHLCRYRRADP